MRSGPMLMQKVGALTAKAALSSIPFAALAFDVGQAGIDFANGRLIDRFLDQLGDRIDHLEAGARERLAADEIHQASADAAIRRLLTESNPRMADALSRAVAELGKPHRTATERMEVARALEALNEPTLHLLQTYYRGRVQDYRMTSAERELVGGYQPDANMIGSIVTASMPMMSWVSSARNLEASGLAELKSDFPGIPGVSSGNFATIGAISPLGEMVLHLCFEDPGVPAFGKFAMPAPER